MTVPASLVVMMAAKYLYLTNKITLYIAVLQSVTTHLSAETYLKSVRIIFVQPGLTVTAKIPARSHGPHVNPTMQYA